MIDYDEKNAYIVQGMPDINRLSFAYSIIHLNFYENGKLKHIIPTFRFYNYDKDKVGTQLGRIKITLYETDVETNVVTSYKIDTVATGLRVSMVRVEDVIDDTRICFKAFLLDSSNVGKTYKYKLVISNILHTNEDGSTYSYTITSDYVYFKFPELEE